jgi:hypothetical protein
MLWMGATRAETTRLNFSMATPIAYHALPILPRPHCMTGAFAIGRLKVFFLMGRMPVSQICVTNLSLRQTYPASLDYTLT